MAAAAKFSHYLTANTLVPTNPSSTGAPLRCTGMLMETPNVTTYLASGTIDASALVNGLLIINTSGESIELTLPTASQIMAAFAAAGLNLSMADSFSTKFQAMANCTAHWAIQQGSGIVPLRSDFSTTPLRRGSAGTLLFVLQQVSPPTGPAFAVTFMNGLTQ